MTFFLAGIMTVVVDGMEGRQRRISLRHWRWLSSKLLAAVVSTGLHNTIVANVIGARLLLLMAVITARAELTDGGAEVVEISVRSPRSWRR